MMAASNARVNLIKIIHVARRELGMDDDVYRMMLADMPTLKGETSTAKLSVGQLRAVLEALKSKGFKVRPKKSAGRPSNLTPGSAMTKIEALLADMSLPWSYADSIASQMFGIQRCAWVRKPEHLKALIASLSVEAEKRSLLQSVTAALKSKGIAESQIENQLKLKSGWQRNRAALKKVLNHLAVIGDE